MELGANGDAAGQDARVALGPLAAASPAAISPLLADEIAAARSYRRQAKPQNTIRSYESDWRQFEAWCNQRGFDSLPARVQGVGKLLQIQSTTLGAFDGKTPYEALREQLESRPVDVPLDCLPYTHLILNPFAFRRIQCPEMIVSRPSLTMQLAVQVRCKRMPSRMT